MTNAEAEAFRQALIEQERSEQNWHLSRFGVDEYVSFKKPDLNERINAKENEYHARFGASRRGSRRGYDSPQEKAKRKGMHDVRSGRLTPESIAIMPTPELYAAAWRTRGELSPSETMGNEMQQGQVYSPQEH